MKQAKFAPIWKSFSLPNVTESTGVNYATPLVIRATIGLTANEHQVSIDDEHASLITSFKRNGGTISYTYSNGVITFPAINQPSILEIDIVDDVTYSIVTGTIVPGIFIDSDGHLKGIVENIPAHAPSPYQFGIRAVWNGIVADTIKTWYATPSDENISWNIASLPSPTIDNSVIPNRAFYTLGEFKRGQSLEIGIDITNPDSTPIIVQSRPVSGMIEATGRFSTLPLGLFYTHDPFVIQGFFPAEAVPGDYYVELYIDEPLPPPPIIVHIKLLGDSFDTFTAINRLNWISEEHLGTINGGDNSHLVIEAIRTDGGTVTYTLAPGSRALPQGLTLASNGEIRGKVPYVSSDTTYLIKVKAKSDRFVKNKEFTFKVKNAFPEARHLTVTLPISGNIRKKWQAYKNQIDGDDRFRPSDPNFGSKFPSVLLIRGLKAKPLPDLKYDEPFELIAGPFKVAQAVIDDMVAYDVIYRELYDPMYRAGGFVPGTEIIENPVYNRQDSSIQITDTSLRNLRSELVMKVGLNASADKAKSLGLDGGEMLDTWMSSIQPNGQAIGYIGAAIIDYVKPGRGQHIAQGLSYGDLVVGSTISFDRMLIEDGATSYFYYMGWDHNDINEVEITAPPAPQDFRIDGVVPSALTGNHPEPSVSWISAGNDVVYDVVISNGTEVLRTVTGIIGSSFRYSAAMQAVDGDPGHVTVKVTARRDILSSPSVEALVLIKGGWGYSWGYQWGGSIA